MHPQPIFSLDELCSLAGVQRRTVRYYIQIGLLDRPVGEKRGAYYQASHLSQLLRIRDLASAGVSLDRVREILAGGETPVPLRRPAPGSVEVRSHVLIAEGVELQISPERSGLSSRQIRALIKTVIDAHSSIKGHQHDE